MAQRELDPRVDGNLVFASLEPGPGLDGYDSQHSLLQPGFPEASTPLGF